MKPYLLLAAAVLTSPSTFAGGFLDLGHLDWGVFLIRGYAKSLVLPPKPAASAAVPVSGSDAPAIPDRPVSADASRPTPILLSPTGAPRHITPGVSP